MSLIALRYRYSESRTDLPDEEGTETKKSQRWWRLEFSRTDLPDEEGTETTFTVRNCRWVRFVSRTDLPDEEGTETQEHWSH